MSTYGTVTCLAPAGRLPPRPSRQTRSFMKNSAALPCSLENLFKGTMLPLHYLEYTYLFHSGKLLGLP